MFRCFFLFIVFVFIDDDDDDDGLFSDADVPATTATVIITNWNGSILDTIHLVLE